MHATNKNNTGKIWCFHLGERMFSPSLNKDFHEKIEDFKKNTASIANYQNLKNIGYLLVLAIIGIIIVLYARKKITILVNSNKKLIGELESGIQTTLLQIEKEFRLIRDSGTYLVYLDKNRFLEHCTVFENNIESLELEKGYVPQNIQELLAQAKKTVAQYKHYVTNYNENFVNNRINQYDELFRKSPVPLDVNQKRAVIVDDKHNLVVAGAGSGKTETLITRIAYLISRKPDTIRPERILALAFQRKAAEEMRARLQARYGFDVKIKTFHALGMEILEKSYPIPPHLMFGGKNSDSEYPKYISSLFNEMKSASAFQKDLLNYVYFFGDNFRIKEEKNFTKKEEFCHYMQNLSYTALDGTKVKSEAERTILNFFLTHTINQKAIHCTYESPATWMNYLDSQGRERSPKPDFFLPEFDLYLEHWAVDKKGNVPSWFNGTDAAKKYVASMMVKRAEFSHKKKFLIETYHWEYENPEFVNILGERLIATLTKKYPDGKFTIQELSPDEIINKVWKDSRESINDLSKNAARFIQIAKTYNLTPVSIKERLSSDCWTRRQQTFAVIALRLYERYESDLRTKNCIDFADMINRAVLELQNKENLYKDVFDQILIDEYQDIRYLSAML